MKEERKSKFKGKRKGKFDKREQRKNGYADAKSESVLNKDRGRNKINGIDAFDSTNDPKWYAASEALLRDSASIPFSQALGNEVVIPSDLRDHWSTSTYPTAKSFVVPGICAVRYLPGVGVSNAFHSAINVAARNIYTFVTSAQSGAKNYEAPDLMMYILAMDSIYAFWNFLVRIYGVTNLYAQKNRYMPRAILAAMNVDADDVLAHLSDLRYGINHATKDIGSMAVPSTLPIIKRHSFMNQYLYLDQPNEKAQMYMYTPEGIHAWVDATDNNPGRLVFRSLWEREDVDNHRWTVSELLAQLNQMIAMVMSSQDFGRMSGDILKAYGNNLLALEEIPETYTVIPVYDEVVLSQIENSIAVGLPLDEPGTDHVRGAFETADIYQLAASNEITYQPEFAFETGMAYDRILNAHTDETIPGLIMEWTRLITVFRSSDVTGSGPSGEAMWRVPAYAAGTEIVTLYSVATLGPDGYTVNLSTSHSFPHWIRGAAGTSEAIDFLCTRSHFNRFPMLICGSSATASWTPGDTLYTGMLADLDNYTVISKQTVRNLHDTAVLGELAVPLIGAVTKSGETL